MTLKPQSLSRRRREVRAASPCDSAFGRCFAFRRGRLRDDCCSLVKLSHRGRGERERSVDAQWSARCRRRTGSPGWELSWRESESDVEYYPESTILHDNGEALLVSLASYKLTYDEMARLWRCDIAVNRGFSGWLALALYRHQPHSVAGLHLSRTATWVYARQFESEVFTYLRRSGYLEVRSGPIYDRHVDFDIVEGELSDDSILVEAKEPVVMEAYEIAGCGCLLPWGRCARRTEAPLHPRGGAFGSSGNGSFHAAVGSASAMAPLRARPNRSFASDLFRGHGWPSKSPTPC